MLSPLSEESLEALEEIGLKKEQAAHKIVMLYGREGIGKTTTAARLGKHNLIVTDEGGWKSLMNEEVQHLIGHWNKPIPFSDYGMVRAIMGGLHHQQILCEDCGEPIDNLIIDTLSGMVAHTLNEISTLKGGPTSGRVHAEANHLADYMVSRDRLYPLMTDMAMMRNCSVTIVAHEKEKGEKDSGERIRPDIHVAGFEVIRKYASIIGRMELGLSGVEIQVKPISNSSVAVKEHVQFQKPKVTIDEFLEHIEMRRIKYGSSVN